MAQGREGGLYVAQWAADPAIALLRNHLFLQGAGLAELLRARRIVEGGILDLAIDRLSAADAKGLARLLADRGAPADDRTHLSRLKHIVDRMSDLAGSPVLRLFGSALRHCYVDRVRTQATEDGAYLAASREVGELRLRQVEAIVDHDRIAAHDLQTRALDIWERFETALPQRRPTPAAIVRRLAATGEGVLIYEFVRPAKKAEAVARAMAQMIADRGLPPGSRLGTEAALIVELGVSRRVFREGARILERFGVAGSERGKTGELVIGQVQGGFLADLVKVGAGDPGLSILPRLLEASARALARVDADRRARIVGMARAGSATLGGVMQLLADHAPDEPTRCFASILLPPWLREHPFAAEADARTLLEAIVSGDRFAAPRSLCGLLGR